MHRRSMLSWLGVSVVGAVNPASSMATVPRKHRGDVVALENFYATDEERMPDLHSYIRKTLQPAMQQTHSAPVLYLEAFISQHRSQIAALTSYASFEEMLQVRDRLRTDPGVRRGRTDLETTQSLRDVQSQVLIAASGSFDLSRNSECFEGGIVEVCSFSSPAWQDGPAAAMMDAFHRAGIQPISGALSVAGEHLPRHTFVIPFASLSASLEAWAKLEADQDWDAMQREAEARFGSKAKLTGKAIYKPAPYSRLA